MKKAWKTGLLCLAAIFLTGCLLSQLQPLFLRARGAVDGSFGLRPTSHACLGLQLDPLRIQPFPEADLRFRAGAFSFAYRVVADLPADRAYCLGQDVWYGE